MARADALCTALHRVLRSAGFDLTDVADEQRAKVGLSHTHTHFPFPLSTDPSPVPDPKQRAKAGRTLSLTDPPLADPPWRAAHRPHLSQHPHPLPLLTDY